MLRTVVLAGLVLSSTLVFTHHASADAAWCRTGREAGGIECIYYTFEQCAASTERLNGGGCIENPRFHGRAAAAPPGAGRSPKARRNEHRRDETR